MDIHHDGKKSFQKCQMIVWTKLELFKGQAVMLAATGRLLTLEGQTTITLCYTFLHQQKIGAKESYNDLMLKNRLSLLAKQAKSRCPIFSAAGFFPVDLSILGLITSTAFAFTIVVIQFILNDNRG